MAKTYIKWNKMWPKVEPLLKTHSGTQVAEMMGISKSALHEYCRRKGHKIRRHNNHLKNLSDEDITMIAILRIEGMSRSDLAEKFDCNVTEITRKTARVVKMAMMRLGEETAEEIAENLGLETETVERLTDGIYDYFKEKRLRSLEALVQNPPQLVATINRHKRGIQVPSMRA